MLEILNHLFAAVCGQNPEHTWTPGGLLLPCCQRCTGLYAGACVAALLHWRLRPKLTARFLEAHGAFLLLMAPFGFHWVPDGPVLRTLTGVLFGFAVVTFLRVSIDWKVSRCVPITGRPVISSARRFGNLRYGRVFADGLQSLRYKPTGAYALGLAVTLGFLPLLAAIGGEAAGYLLSGIMFWGAAALGGLVLANAGFALLGAARLVCRRTRESLQS